MRTRYIAAAAVLAVAASLSSMQTAEAASTVRFSRIYYNSPGTDTGSNSSLNHEWIRLHNYGTNARTLTGWTVRDTSGHVFRFPAFKLRAGTSVTVHTGRGTNTRTDLYWRQDWYVWNNTGDTARLKNKAGTTLDRCHYKGGGSAANC